MPLARTTTHVRAPRQQPRRRRKPYKQNYKSKFSKPTHAVIKSHKAVGYSNVALFGTSPSQLGSDPVNWQLIKPLNLNRVANSAPDDNDRQSNTLFARNCSTLIEVFPSKRYRENFQIRVCYGYFKGDTGVGSQGLTASNMKAIYPTINDKLWDREDADKQDFLWKYQKTYTLCPRQIWDEDTEEGDGIGVDRVMVANWMPRKFKVNFRFNRRVNYENSDGDSLQGYMPIIAVQCMPVPGASGFTRPDMPVSADNGIAPCPRLHISSVTYFNDIH